MPPLLRGKKRSRAESTVSPDLLRGKKRSRADFSLSPGPQLQLDDDDVIVLDDAAAVRASSPGKSRDVGVMDSNVDSSSVPHVLRVSEAAVRKPDSDEDAELQKVKDELACSMCLDLCYEPCTVSCSHTFCKTCLSDFTRAYGSQCPKCRAEFSLGRQGHVVNTMIWNIIQLLFADACAERKRAIDAENEVFGGEGLFELDMSDAFPEPPLVYVRSFARTRSRRRRTARMNAG